MKEHLRLQRICQLGYRLQELGLMPVTQSGSIVLATLHHLMHSYRVTRVPGQNLEQTLYRLGLAVIARHQLQHHFLTPDAVLDFFGRRLLVDRSPATRSQARTRRVESRIAA